MGYNNYRFKRLKRFKAFSLIEILFTLSIVSFLLLAGVYYEKKHTNQTKLTLWSNQFYFDLTFAREQALLHKKSISVCPLDILNTKEKWKTGYQIAFEPVDHSNISATTPLLIRKHDYFETLSIESHFGLNAPCVYFNEMGQSAFNGNFSYTLENSNTYAKIILTQTGKMHLETR